jgi:hypothetical protein
VKRERANSNGQRAKSKRLRVKNKDRGAAVGRECSGKDVSRGGAEKRTKNKDQRTRVKGKGGKVAREYNKQGLVVGGQEVVGETPTTKERVLPGFEFYGFERRRFE